MRDFYQLELTNYCYPDCKPLLNIMRLEKESAFVMAKELAESHPGLSAFYRFQDFDNYYELRLKQDEFLYHRFCELRGRPEERHPLSFVIGDCDYLKEWFGNGYETKLFLGDIEPAHISFTLGDSGALFKRNGTVEVLTVHEFRKYFESSGGEINLLLKNSDFHYIEAQLWSDVYINGVR